MLFLLKYHCKNNHEVLMLKIVCAHRGMEELLWLIMGSYFYDISVVDNIGDLADVRNIIVKTTMARLRGVWLGASVTPSLFSSCGHHNMAVTWLIYNKINFVGIVFACRCTIVVIFSQDPSGAHVQKHSVLLLCRRHNSSHTGPS